MVKHIVFFRFEKENKSPEFLAEVKKRLESMMGRIEGMAHLEAGVNFSTRDVAWDMALISDFKTREDLFVYRDHPVHMEFVNYLKAFKHEVCVVDYDY